MASGIIAKKLPEWAAIGESGVRCGDFDRSYVSLETLERLRSGEWKRGRIGGFSRHSARRLREALFRYHVPNARCCGLTLTVPWVWSADLLPEWRRVFRAFAQSFRRRFPESAMIYRVELQRRGAPHVHAVAYVAENAPLEALRRLWFDSVVFRGVGRGTRPRGLHGGDIGGFNRHGADVRPMDGDDADALFRYLCDHASKRKREQLGYGGRQWGFVNRPALRARASEPVVFSSDSARRWFYRYLRRLRAYAVADPRCVFGSRKVCSRRTFGVSFLRHGRASALRLVECAERTAGLCQ